MNTRTMASDQSRRIREMALLTGALRECLEFVEGQSDLVDRGDGQPRANRAMQLAETIRDALIEVGDEP